MEKGQEIFIKSRNSDYLHEIVAKKDWDSLIELVSSRDAFNNLVLTFFQNDESKAALKEMSSEQILTLIDTAPLGVANQILDRMESFCDTDSKYTEIAFQLMKGVFTHGGDMNISSIVNCLPLNVLRTILDSRIPFTEYHFGRSYQEFFMHILASLESGHADYSYKNLKERDCTNGVFTYIDNENNSFPLGRREVFKEVIKALRDSFSYVENNNSLDYKLPFIRDIIINPFIRLICRGLSDPVLDYKNDKEIVQLIKSIFDEFYGSKYFFTCAHVPILTGNGNNGILINSATLEDAEVISPNYYYKVFKAAVESNKDNFIDKITRVFFTSCNSMIFIRELKDGIYEKLFAATIEMTVRELIERKQSENFRYCCNLLSYKQCHTFRYTYMPNFEECLGFIKSVISKIFEKASTLNVDATAYPEICCYMLNNLNRNEIMLPTPRNPDSDITYSLNQLCRNSHTALDLLDAEMRNNLVLGVIRHPTDNKKFSHIITSNNPTTLVNFICNLHSVQDIRLVLAEEKRNTVDKFGFRDGRSASNPKEVCKLNLVEIFLQTLRFWENNDKSLFKDGYTSYYQFVRKILTESIITKNDELKKLAIDAYYRFAELVSLAKNAKYVTIRIKIASVTFLTPLAVIVGSQLNKSFVENFVNKYIQPFSAQSYQTILSEIISRSHLNMNYYADEKEDNEVDNLFKEIRIDEEMANATRLLLGCIKQNPVKNFKIYYTHRIQEDFFTSQVRITNCIKNKFQTLNPRILDVCNPLKTPYALGMNYNNPVNTPVMINEPTYEISHLVFLELCRFIGNEFKEYSPNLFKSNLTKTLIQIQNLVTDMSKGNYETFNNVFYLDPPTRDTQRNFYYSQSQIRVTLLYSKPFFNFLNEINHNANSIYNDESYEIIKNAFIAQFLNEEDFLQQKNKPPPKFNGFDILLTFRAHQNAENIFNFKNYIEEISNFKQRSYQNVNNQNNGLIRLIERSYEPSKLLDDKPFDDVFAIDQTNHRSRELSVSARPPYYSKNVHQCFTTIIDSLNKCKAESFAEEFDSLERLQNFFEIKDYGSSSSSYSMLTELLDLLINDFVSTKTNLSKMYKNRLVTYNDVYRFMTVVAHLASPNIGTLQNLEKVCALNERTIAQKVPNRTNELFDYIFRNGNIDQILLCMNSALFSTSASYFYNFMLSEFGLLRAKSIVNSLINEVSNNGKQILDDFHVSLASCAIHPRFAGFPAPQSTLDYLKKITSKSIYAKRSACANAIYYAIMSHTANEKIPLKDIMEIIESAHKKSPDEITAFFCILISRDASLRKMASLPALNDLMIEEALPNHYIINQNFQLNLPKEIGDLYYKVIENIILSGLKSKKSHIYELTVTVLNEINVGPEIHQIISPFIEKGLKEIEPSDDNEAFLTYATSFTMKNPEFKGCFDSYCEALKKIQKHSFAILKANAHLNRDSPYPEPFKKLENSYSTIINTIEKPFDEFKEENEMIPVSQFCRKLLPVLKQNRPAVARDVFLRLESYASIFGDALIEEMVHLYKQDKKEESLSKFIVIVTHHDELVINLPQSIRRIYSHLSSSFTKKHSIELSKNLADSQGKLPISMQRAYQLAELFSSDVLAHLPDDLSEDELVDVLSNLGIFCKNNREVRPIHGRYAAAEAQAVAYDAAPMMMNRAFFGRAKAPCAPCAAPPPQADMLARPMRKMAMKSLGAAPMNMMEVPAGGAMVCNDACADVCDEAMEECVCEAAEAPMEADDAEDEAADGAEPEESAENEADGEGELNQDQINDAFDLFF